MIKVSVVIPVYNGDAFLRQCLESVHTQTLEEIEVICVDDGSTDTSPDILEEFRAKDTRFRIIHQENQHVAAARNNGLAQAQGEYVIFWDCDDFFEPQALELLYNRAEETEADICICKNDLYDGENEKSYPSNDCLDLKLVPKEATFNRSDIPEHILTFTNAVVWNKLFRRSFLVENSLTFPSFRIGEDRAFVFLALCTASKITFVKNVLVHYRWNNPKSLMGKSSSGAQENLLALEAAMDQLTERGILPEGYEKKMLASVVHCLHQTRTEKDFMAAMRLLREDGLLEKFGIRERAPGYYSSPVHDEYVRRLLYDEPGDILAYFMHTMWERQRITAADRRSIKTELNRSEKRLTALLEEREALLKEVEKKRKIAKLLPWHWFDK